MTEAQFRQEVIRRAAFLGLLVHSCKDSRHCEGSNGFPDLIIAGPKGVLFVELKLSAGGKLRPGQTTWRYTLVASGVAWRLWTPETDPAQIDFALSGLG